MLLVLIHKTETGKIHSLIKAYNHLLLCLIEVAQAQFILG